MSLNWNVTKCADHEALSTDEQWPITQTRIFATMAVGIGEIRNDDDAAEFFARLSLLDSLDGPFLVDGKGKRSEITPDMVRRYVGLSTNVFPRESRAKWLKRIGEARLDDSVRTAKRSWA